MTETPGPRAGTDAAPRRRAALGDYLSLIKFSHSVFALPFALIALLCATGGRPTPRLLLLVVLAMVLARSAAMAYNRFADRELDAQNPRTRGREIPRGVIPARAALWLALACALGFVAVAALLGPLCFWLSWPVLALLLGYSHAKRLTDLSHVWLGAALGLAPPAAWVAAVGRIDEGVLAPLVLGCGVTLWVAGFDVLYACQDEAFDKQAGLRSLPVRLGRRRALAAARVLHAAAVVLFALFGVAAGLGLLYFAGVALAAALLGHQHRLVSAEDLGRIGQAFFTMNGLVSLAMLGFTALDLHVL